MRAGVVLAARNVPAERRGAAALDCHDIVHAPAGVCKACGGTDLRQIGESVTEVLEYIPGRFEVTRHVRPAVSCRKCEAMIQAPMPELPIPRGMAGASLLAHVATSKFCEHLPLYGQAEIYARGGVDVDRGQLTEWLGHIAWLLKPRLDELATCLDAQLQRIPGKSNLAGAIRYARSRWPALTAYADHGQLEISNNAAENAIRTHMEAPLHCARCAPIRGDPWRTLADHIWTISGVSESCRLPLSA